LLLSPQVCSCSRAAARTGVAGGQQDGQGPADWKSCDLPDRICAVPAPLTPGNHDDWN